jgi:hypothetical protein
MSGKSTSWRKAMREEANERTHNSHVNHMEREHNLVEACFESEVVIFLSFSAVQPFLDGVKPRAKFVVVCEIRC